jgi:hypothetical protein
MPMTFRCYNLMELTPLLGAFIGLEWDCTCGARECTAQPCTCDTVTPEEWFILRQAHRILLEAFRREAMKARPH